MLSLIQHADGGFVSTDLSSGGGWMDGEVLDWLGTLPTMLCIALLITLSMHPIRPFSSMQVGQPKLCDMSTFWRDEGPLV
jgi:hypothetical protein